MLFIFYFCFFVFLCFLFETARSCFVLHFSPEFSSVGVCSFLFLSSAFVPSKWPALASSFWFCVVSMCAWYCTRSFRIPLVLRSYAMFCVCCGYVMFRSFCVFNPKWFWCLRLVWGCVFSGIWVLVWIFVWKFLVFLVVYMYLYVYNCKGLGFDLDFWFEMFIKLFMAFSFWTGPGWNNHARVG